MPRRLWLAVCALAIVPVLIAACGGDGADADAEGSPSASPSAPGNSSVSTATPILSSPAGKYSVSIEDIGNAWLTDIARTYVITARSYCENPCLFPSQAEGEKLLRQWGYVDGYETGYIPEGREDTVLKGGYYIKVETHLFETAEGARQAFQYFSEYAKTGGFAAVDIQPVGNSSLATAALLGTIGNTQVKALYHQIVFVRGNALTVILTKGAQGFMKVDSAWNLATIADEKLLGERAAPQPTPTSNYQTPTPEPVNK